MTDEVMNQVEAIDRKRSAVLKRIQKAKSELARLETDRERILLGKKLPTEPGWYLTADDTPARLGEDGRWDDGWGNDGPDYVPAWVPLPLRRLIVEEAE